jgi:hypothetical protein
MFSLFILKINGYQSFNNKVNNIGKISQKKKNRFFFSNHLLFSSAHTNDKKKK